MNRFAILVGDVMPEYALNTSLYNTCYEYDGAFGAGSIEKLHCYNQLYCRYVIIYIPGFQYLTVCEVQVFGYRGKQNKSTV